MSKKKKKKEIPRPQPLGYHIKASLEMMQKSALSISDLLNHVSTSTYAYGGYISGSGGGMSGSGQSMTQRHRKDFSKHYQHPVPNKGTSTLTTIIIDLNDNERWTREEIADWLDTLDDQPIFYPNTCPNDCTCEECKPLQTIPSLTTNQSVPSAKLVSGELISNYLPLMAASDVGISYTANHDDADFPNSVQMPPPSYTGKISFDISKVGSKLSQSMLDALQCEMKQTTCWEKTFTFDGTSYELTYIGSAHWVAEKLNTVKGLINNVQPQPHICPDCLYPNGGSNIHYTGCTSGKSSNPGG